MTENQKKLLKILEDMFQFDQADLDFGIYRIMSMKRDEVKKFLNEDLPAQITDGLKHLANISSESQINVINEQIKETKASYLGEAIKSAAIAELEEKKKSLMSKTDMNSLEADVYSHLTNFFARYYDDGDFISQRRYKEGVYAIPYEGEEVKLHWANADQYYVKTSEYFKDYTFKTNLNNSVHFKIIEAETDKDNNKSNEKRFFQLYTNKPFEIIDNELFIYIEYKNGRKTNQKDCNAEIVAEFSKVAKDFDKFSGILNITDGKTLLERQIDRYTARNTFDYFIHKDLGKFLNRELDFYVKNDVIFLDDIEEQDESKTKEYLTKAKVIRKIAKKIITFLAQIEDFEKKLFLKKKFVVETNYCITLDRIPKKLYDEIISNTAQLEEWKRLFAIDEIKSDLTTVAYSEPLTKEFLEQNKFLMLDTKFFSNEFKDKLVDSIDDLDENLDGLIINSENFQALSLLKERYKEQVKCIYIDPPYNAQSSEILYKNNFKHSSWISLLENRLLESKIFQSEDSVLVVAIDEVEQERLGMLLNLLYPELSRTNIAVVHNPSGQQGNTFSYTHEYACFVYPDRKNVIGKEHRDDDDADVRPLRDVSGNDNRREDAANCFYPIYVKDNKIIGFGDICEDDYHPQSANICREGGIIEVYPIDASGIEKKWVFARQTVESIFDELTVEYNKSRNIVDIIRTKKVFNFKTAWTDKKYSANSYGSKLLNAMFKNTNFLYPKSLYNVIDCVRAGLGEQKDKLVLDFFAGSGTTAHAVIYLNREDEGNRKYILVEMGEYFDSVTKPRIEKVVYSEDWKDGKPVSRKGSSHAFKYIRLESYEDALNNIALNKTAIELLGSASEEYLLSYMLNMESKNSDCLLNIERLAKPFDYVMNITHNLENKERNIDIVETFNYLIGLKVERSYALSSFDADFKEGEYGVVTATLKEGRTYKIKMVEGKTLNGESVLVIWRELTGDTVKDNAVLDAFFNKKKISTNDFEYKKIYVNGDNNLQNTRSDKESWKVILIEEEMKNKMFENKN